MKAAEAAAEAPDMATTLHEALDQSIRAERHDLCETPGHSCCELRGRVHKERRKGVRRLPALRFNCFPLAVIPLEGYWPKDNSLPQGDDGLVDAVSTMRPSNRWEN